MKHFPPEWFDPPKTERKRCFPSYQPVEWLIILLVLVASVVTTLTIIECHVS